MPNIVIQQIKIADYKNILKCSLKVIVVSGLLMDHQTNENCPFSEQKVLFDRSWKLQLLSAHSEFLIFKHMKRNKICDYQKN